MHFFQFITSLRWRCWLAVPMAVGCMGLGMELAKAQDPPAVNDNTPLIVNDDGETKTALPSQDAAGGAAKPAVPSAPPSAPGLVGENEVVRKAIVESATLLDPTKPVPQVPGVGQAPGSDVPGSLLLPQNPTGTNQPLSTPETSAALKPVEPIIGSAPFKEEPKSDGGPVVMGTDLDPNAAVTPLSPEQTPPEFLDGPIVEPTDPWVFSVEVASLYDDNIRLSNREAQQDFLFVLSASVAWQWGDIRLKRGSWARVYYEATGVAFAEQSDENSVDHDFQAGVQKRAGRSAAALEGRYRRLSGATPDLGDRVQRDDYQVKLSGAYELGGRTYLEGNTSWNAVRYQDSGLADYDEILGELFAGYELSGRTKVSAGGAVGQLKVAGSGKQDFQRALFKVARASTGALGLTGKAGAEFRQTKTRNNVTPVFSIAADYEPVEDSTRVTAEIFRETVASGALAGENYLRTGGALRLTQRLGSRFVAGVDAGYERLEYAEAASGVDSGRSDDYFFAKPSLKYEFNARRRAEVFYSFREDESSLEDFSFTANQWGLSFGLDF